MLKEVIIWGRYQAETLVLDRPYIHIVIFDPNSPIPQLVETPNRIGAIFLGFHDVGPHSNFSNGKWDPNGIVFMDEDDAKTILAFVETYKDEAETLVINCEAGISRSAGIGAALCALYDLNDEVCYIGKAPNVHCKSLLLRTAGQLRKEQESHLSG